MIVLLILASVGLMVVETALDAESVLAAHVETVEVAITSLFALELAGRLYVMGSLRRFLASYWVDCLAVAPLLRPLRILRVLRLLRLFRAGFMVNRWLSRLESTFARGYREYLVVTIVAATMILTGSMSIYILEGGRNPGIGSFAQSVWWATFTMMAGEPVGAEPQTAQGRVVLLIMMLGGMTVFALLTGTISALMVERLRGSLEARDMQIEELEDHIIVCGWNRGGPRLVAELGQSVEYADRAVVLIADLPRDEDPEIDFRHIGRDRVFVVRADYTRIQVLKDCGIHRAGLAILLADKLGQRSDQDRDARTVLAALSIEKLNPSIFTCAELLHQENAHPLKLAGVEEIVIASELSSTIMAHASLNDGLVGLIDEILTSSYGNAFHKSDLPEDWTGFSFEDVMLRLRTDHHALLVAAERRHESGTGWVQHVNPLDFQFRAGDRLVFLSRESLHLT